MINESSLSETLMSVLCSSGKKKKERKKVFCFGDRQNFTAGEEMQLQELKLPSLLLTGG